MVSKGKGWRIGLHGSILRFGWFGWGASSVGLGVRCSFFVGSGVSHGTVLVQGGFGRYFFVIFGGGGRLWLVGLLIRN